jgi:polysaccharide export outer membrane protein
LTFRVIQPRDSVRVFVDVGAYNSKNYVIQGDVHAPGKLPWTGNDTVLDAINYAAGLLPGADRSSIRLVRPGANGKGTRTYPVNLDAILERGDQRANYQLFPGDRLIVGRERPGGPPAE